MCTYKKIQLLPCTDDNETIFLRTTQKYLICLTQTKLNHELTTFLCTYKKYQFVPCTNNNVINSLSDRDYVRSIIVKVNYEQNTLYETHHSVWERVVDCFDDWERGLCCRVNILMCQYFDVFMFPCFDVSLCQCVDDQKRRKD